MQFKFLILLQMATQNGQQVFGGRGGARPRSALDYWEDALQASTATASNKSNASSVGKDNPQVHLRDVHFGEVVGLWSDLCSIYGGRPSRLRSRRHPKHHKSANGGLPTFTDALRRAPNPPASSTGSIGSMSARLGLVNLHSIEQQFQSRSTDSETLEADSATRMAMAPPT